ncbi:MAG TPA: RtcB family protein, partial [Legionellaceae bacterium]|nr:RtcB family protein [Legionellaceae bacterium]
DGFKYCFTTSTGFWIMRRNGVIAITGNCGMGAIKTTLRASDLPDNLEALRSAIEAAIPVGFNSHDEPAFKGSAPDGIKKQGSELFSNFRSLTENVQDLLGKAKRQVGTLGGGNHFIEICLDKGCNGPYSPDSGNCDKDCEPNVWLMLHSGSRNIGKELAEYHINIAKKLVHNQDLPDKDLAVFLAGTPEMVQYRHDLMWAQDYAMFNRRVMFVLLKQTLRTFFPNIDFAEPILCHHNYISEECHFGEEVFVTRKGAINAATGQMGIIPGSMGAKSFIVRGLGNPESFHSASHGAGRKMSRGAAKRNFTQEDLIKQTEGVCCRKDTGVIDEIPGAYKDIEEVMRNQSDLVEVVAELKQILCVKG